MDKLEPYKEEDYKGFYNLKQMEKQHLKYWMREHEGNRKKVAKVLGITERSVYNKLQRHNL